MKKITGILVLGFSMFLVQSINAQTLSSGPYFLDGGIIPSEKNPKEPGTFDLSLAQLPLNEGFDLSCDIINDNYNKPYPVVISVSANYAILFTVNGLSSRFDQFLLDNPTNKFKAKIYKLVDTGAGDNTIHFKNFDTADSVQIINCIAVYNTN